MNWVGYAGWAMIGFGFVAVLGGALAALPSILRARRTSAETGRLAEMYRLEIEAQARERDRLLAEQEATARPLRRIARWATHPLVLALFESYRRRRRRTREAVV